MDLSELDTKYSKEKEYKKALDDTKFDALLRREFDSNFVFLKSLVWFRLILLFSNFSMWLSHWRFKLSLKFAAFIEAFSFNFKNNKLIKKWKKLMKSLEEIDERERRK